MAVIPEVPSDITPQQFFEQFLVEHFSAITEGKISDIDAVLQVNIAGDGGGTWSMTVKGGNVAVQPSGDPAAIAVMHIDVSTWGELMALSGEFSRRASGNVSGAFKFLFPQAQMIQMIRNSPQGTACIRLDREGAPSLNLYFGFKECNPEAVKTTVSMALNDWIDLATKKVVPAQLMMSGKAKVEGDMALAMNMSMLMT